MVTTTGRRLIRAAFTLIGAYGPADSIPDTDEQAAQARLNSLIDSWGLQPLTTPVTSRTEQTLVSGTASYTIGDGGDFDMPRPVYLTGVAYLVPDTDPAVESPVPLLTQDGYDALQIKGLENPLITLVRYDRTAPLGTVTVWPVPTQTLTIVLYTQDQIAPFDNLTLSVTLPPGLERALRTNLALELAPEWARPVPEDVRRMAHASLRDLKYGQLEMSDMPQDPALTYSEDRPGWNIQTGP